MLMRTYRQHRWSDKAPWKVCGRDFDLTENDFVRHVFWYAHMQSEFNPKFKKVERRLTDKYCPQLTRMIVSGIKKERF